MKHRSGLQEEDDDNGKDNMNIERLASPRLPSTGEKHSTTTIKAIKNVDEDTRTTTGMKTTTTESIIDTVDVNDYCMNEKAASKETIQNSKNDKITRRIIQKNEEIRKEDASSDDDEYSNVSDTSISDRPGAIAIQGPRFRNNDTFEDGTVQYSAEEVETAIQTQEEEAARKPTIHDPLEAERVLEIAQGISVTLNQSNSQTKWKRLAIILGIFVFILCVVAAVLIAFFVRSNNNNNKSLSPPESTPPVVATVAPSSPADLPTFGPSMIPSSAPTSVQEQIMNVLLEYFPDLPASNDQEQALDWILTDPTSLGVFMDDGLTETDKKRMILERFVLATIYFATNGVGWSRNNLWVSSLSVCQWEDIECNGDGSIELREIGFLDLHNNRLLGSIPTGVGWMTSMVRLDLSDNALTGSIPTEVGLMTSMELFTLYNNALTGFIPTELGSITSLNSLSLASNDLSGSIPTELGSMASLTWLNLDTNALSGSIPTELGLMTSMISLLLSSNNLSRSIPTQLGLMTRMTLLDLSNNDLLGSIPTELGSITSMIALFLGDNAISGSIPTELGFMTSMTRLVLGSFYSYTVGNALSGSIPTELGLMTNMKYLNFDNNLLTGSIPTEVGSLTRLTWLGLYGNSNLTGTIPSEVIAILPNVRNCFMGNTRLIDVPENCK